MIKFLPILLSYLIFNFYLFFHTTRVFVSFHTQDRLETYCLKILPERKVFYSFHFQNAIKQNQDVGKEVPSSQSLEYGVALRRREKKILHLRTREIMKT